MSELEFNRNFDSFLLPLPPSSVFILILHFLSLHFLQHPTDQSSYTDLIGYQSSREHYKSTERLRYRRQAITWFPGTQKIADMAPAPVETSRARSHNKERFQAGFSKVRWTARPAWARSPLVRKRHERISYKISQGKEGRNLYFHARGFRPCGPRTCIRTARVYVCVLHRGRKRSSGKSTHCASFSVFVCV